MGGQAVVVRHRVADVHRQGASPVGVENRAQHSLGFGVRVLPRHRHMTAVGAERKAARALGVDVRRIPFFLYVTSGLASALGGLILTSQLDGASVSIGIGPFSAGTSRLVWTPIRPSGAWRLMASVTPAPTSPPWAT